MFTNVISKKTFTKQIYKNLHKKQVLVDFLNYTIN